MRCDMKRAEYIAKGGGCEELREGSKILKPIIVEWLEEDIDETHT